MSEKGKPAEKQGRKAEGLRRVFCYDGRATWNTLCILGVSKMVITKSEVEVIDQEWMALILEAKDLGLSIEAVRDFLVNER